MSENQTISLIMKGFSILINQIFQDITNFKEHSINKNIDMIDTASTLGADIFIIHIIGNKKECTMGDIIENLKIKNSTAKYKIDQLINRNYLTRYIPRSDKRKRCLRLTNRGRKLNNQYFSYIFSKISPLVEGTDISKMNCILEYLRKLNSNI